MKISTGINTGFSFALYGKHNQMCTRWKERESVWERKPNKCVVRFLFIIFPQLPASNWNKDKQKTKKWHKVTAYIWLLPHALCVQEEVVGWQRGPETKEGREIESEIQLFPSGSVVMATEAFPARRGTNRDERVCGGWVRWRGGGGGW